MFKTLHHKVSKIKDYKYWESQLFFNKECFYLNFDISFNVDKIAMTKHFDINIFGLFIVSLHKDDECDHAGTVLELGLFGLGYQLSHIDTRHWDDDKEEFINH